MRYSTILRQFHFISKDLLVILPNKQTLTFTKPLWLLLQNRIAGGGENIIERQ